MKILIVHNRYRIYGGEDTVVNQEFATYQELGHQVALYEANNKELTGIDLIFSVFNFFSAKKFKKFIQDYNPDIIHIHNLIFKLSPSILTVISKRTKVFMTVHNYRFICPSGTFFVNGKINLDSKTKWGLLKNICRGVYQNSILKTLILTILYRFNILIGTFGRVDSYVFLSEFAQTLHLDFNKKVFGKSVVKPNFLNESRPKEAVKYAHRDIDLLFAGRFVEEKGIMDVLGTICSNKHLNIHLAGDGPLLDEVLGMTNIYEHITVHGKLERKDAMDLFKRSKYMIFPSKWFEGMPMTIIEAFSYGVPVIARNLGAMKTMIDHGHTGYLYHDLDGLQTIIEQLPNQSWDTTSKNCVSEFASRYSFEKSKENIQKLLESHK